MRLICLIIGHSYQKVGYLYDNPNEGDIWEAFKCERCGLIDFRNKKNMYEEKDVRTTT